LSDTTEKRRALEREGKKKARVSLAYRSRRKPEGEKV